MQNGTVWNTKSVEEATEKIQMGIPTNTSCFWNQDPDLKAPNIAFQFTDWEEQEFVKCSLDIEYFVENYCKFQTDQGLRTVNLRDYQRDILNAIGDEEWVDEINEFAPRNRDYILLASRQIGKCLTFNSLVSIYNESTGSTFNIEIGKFFTILYAMQNKLTLKQKVINKLKLFLYKIYEKI
ncbi:MAG: hypothetical protein ACOC22_00740 [bacterium]